MYDIDPQSQLQKDLDAQEHQLNIASEKIMFLAIAILTLGYIWFVV